MTSKELIEQTKRLIAIPSTADNPTALRQAVDFVAGMITKRCPDVTFEWFETHGKHSFLAYRGKLRPAEFDILLNVHVDVVPGKPEQFKAVEKNGRLYGRGALDMKGTTLALADAFCELVDDAPYSLGLQVVSDEEIGGEYGTRVQIESGVRAKFVIMGEYANEKHVIYNAARGLCWAEIVFKGRSAHGGHLWKGTNAVVKAGDFAGAVLKHYPTPDKETWTTTASIASLQTPNQTFNRVPDTAVLKIDFRFTKADPVFRDLDSLRAFIASIDPDAELVAADVFGPAVHVDELNPYVQGLSAAMRQATGSKPQYLGRPAASDGRHFAVIDNDIIEFGLYGKDSHADNESVELKSFAEYQAIMHGFLAQPIPAKLKPTIVRTEPLGYTVLRELVARPTVTSDRIANEAALGYIGKFLSDRGMHVEQFEYEGFDSIVATTKVRNKRPAVMLYAHIDVVPGKPEQFKLSVKGDELHGRGVLDMKAAIASYLAVVDELRLELGAYDFGIMITSDEEVGGKHGAEKLVQEAGYRPGVVIVPDGGEGWQIERFAKGVQWIKLVASGKAGHASRPWEGDDAIHRLLGALHDIKALVPANPSREDTILSVGTIEGGTTANQIPSAASAMLDVRYGSLADYEQLYPRIQDVSREHGVEAILVVSSPPCVTDLDDPLIKPFRRAIAEACGQAAGSSMSYAATDGRYFSAVGIPCIVTTPPGAGRHKDDEWLSKTGFDQFGVILKQYLTEVAAEPALAVVPVKGQEYVWYASYGSGLCKELFMSVIEGGRPAGAARDFRGCTDKTPPLRDYFMALPHALYFGGESETWTGGFPTLGLAKGPKAHTIARAYLITLAQYKEILAQENSRDRIAELPIEAAIKHGHATIGDGTGNYEELMYCGTKDGYPIFAVTATTPRQPYAPPSPAYTRMLCIGLSQDKGFETEAAVDYLMQAQGINGTYKPAELSALMDETTASHTGRPL